MCNSLMNRYNTEYNRLLRIPTDFGLHETLEIQNEFDFLLNSGDIWETSVIMASTGK